MKETQYSKTRKKILTLIDQLKKDSILLLPTEKQLVEQLDVGRNTIRNVISDIVDNGLLERIPGKGTFILDKKDRLSFSNWVGTEPPGQEILRDYFDDFVNNNSGIEIEEINIPYRTYVFKLLQRFLNGISPDVIQLTPFWLQRFEQLDLFSPLENLINQNNLKRRYSIDIDSCKVNGNLYALNWTLTPLVLYYNKVVLERAGLDPDKPPSTLDELREMSVKVNKGENKNVHGILLPLQPYEYHLFWLYPFLMAFNGGFVDSIGNVTIDCEENATALTWLTHTLKEGGSLEEYNIYDIRIRFAHDRVAFMVDGPYCRGHLRQISSLGKKIDDRYGIALIPARDFGKSRSILLSHALAISKQCRHPELASKFIDFLSTNAEHSRYYFEEFGMIPCMRDLLIDPFYRNNPFASVLIKQIESASLGPIKHTLFARSLAFLSPIVTKSIISEGDPMRELRLMRGIVEMMSKTNTLALPLE